MSKEEIIEKYTKEWISQDNYGIINLLSNCMIEYADQEKEKVAVAFAEWKDDNVVELTPKLFVITRVGFSADQLPSYRYRDLYQYFITKVYNK